MRLGPATVVDEGGRRDSGLAKTGSISVNIDSDALAFGEMVPEESCCEVLGEGGVGEGVSALDELEKLEEGKEERFPFRRPGACGDDLVRRVIRDGELSAEGLLCCC